MNPISTESGLTVEQLIDFINTHECYDNSKLEAQQGCKRKGFYQQIGPTGFRLAKRVGEGADFGTCMHAAHEAYYTNWGQISEGHRRIESIKSFEENYQALFPHGTSDKRHTLDNGIDIWDDYCDGCLPEDPLYRPVDPEIGFVVRIAPRPSEHSFTPFWYMGRADGIWERLAERDYFVGELKTSSGGVDRRIKSLTFHRQPVGYVAMARELVSQGKFEGVSDPQAIKGSFVSVIGILTSKREFDREYFSMDISRTEKWRRQTIIMVEEWRYRKRQLEAGTDWEDIFYQETEECTKYGLCPYWDLCQYGITADSLAPFEEDTWNPIVGNRGPAKLTVVETEDSGVIRLTK